MLYPAYLCDALLRLAEASAYRSLWSADVLAELRRNLIDCGVPAERVERRIAQRARSFPDALVDGSLIDGMTNDPKDWHVLGAAVSERRGARHVQRERLSGAGAEGIRRCRYTSDEFLLDQLDLYPGVTIEVMRQQAASYCREPSTVAGVLVLLERAGVRRFAAQVRRHL